MSRREYWRWHVSAQFYRRTYIRIAHQLDRELFAYLGERTRGAIVADCGCGPGVVAEKFVQQGAARVLAIDVNAGMLRQTQARLADAIAAGRVEIMGRLVDAALFADLGRQVPDGLDLIVFKRSLYAPPEQSRQTLRAALHCLRPDGALVVIHADRSLRRYAFGPRLRPTRYTAYHLFNRFVSRLGELLGVGRYTLYTQAELLALLRDAGGDRKIELIPSQQQAYIMVAVWNTVHHEECTHE